MGLECSGSAHQAWLGSVWPVWPEMQEALWLSSGATAAARQGGLGGDPRASPSEPRAMEISVEISERIK